MVTLKVIAQIFFILFNIITARYQARRFDWQQKQISHKGWAIMYFIMVVVAYLLLYGVCDLVEALRSWSAAFAFFITPGALYMDMLIIGRLPVFNTALNYYRRPRRPLFYINPMWSNKKNNSWFDRIWSRWYPIVFFTCIAIYITLQFFIYADRSKAKEPPKNDRHGITNLVAK